MRLALIRFCAVMAVAALTACSSMTIPPPPPPPAVDGGQGETAATAVVVREMLPRGTAFSTTAASYPFRAIILLTDRSSARNKKLCKAYMDLLTTPDIARLVVPGAQPIPTYWPVRSPISSTDCATMLSTYDFEAAKALLQVYGRADAKGPVFIVADRNNRFAFIDMSSASEAQMRSVVTGWYAGVVQNGLKNATLASPDFFELFGQSICGLTNNLVAQQLPPQGGDLEDPKTWGWDGQRWTKPSILRVGALLFGGTITNTVCGIAATLA